ncbi:MAG: TIR and AAA domain-containing protein, partial [Akkermansiaceae bacterium]|nr:TIR and AAA domain-containing protein [Akkermansiaceae bacterium]
MPEVFLSYRQTSDPERQRVRAFAERLRSSGIRVIFDQFFLEEHPGGPNDGWDKWSSDRALHTSHVIIIGRESWFQCFDKTQPPGTGLGAACEADDIRHRVYEANGIVETIRVVLFDDADSQHISPKLKRYHRFHADRDFDLILRWLNGTTSATTASPSEVRHSEFGIRHSSLPTIQRFFGRDTELAKLLPDLHPNATGWGALIDGPGGMGKTTLAIRAAELAAPGHYDDIVFLSAKQTAMDPHGPHDESPFAVSGFTQMLDAIARRLQKPEITQADAA